LLLLLPLPLLLLHPSSKCRDTEPLGPATSNYPAANSTCWQVNRQQSRHEIWLEEDKYGPTVKPLPLPLSCGTSLSPMRLKPSTCGGRVTSCRLNYCTAQSRNKTKNQIIFLGFGPRGDSSRTHHQSTSLTHVRDLSAADPQVSRATEIKLTSSWQMSCPFVVNRIYHFTVRIVIIRAVAYKCGI
jgi:hypothetical protein